MKKIYLLCVILLVCLGGYFFQQYRKATVLTLYTAYSDLRENVTPFIDKLDKKGIFKRKNVGIYLANFFNDNYIYSPKENEDISILWLGSNNSYIDVNIVKKYDYVFASTYSLRDFLLREKIIAHYLPFIYFDNKKTVSKQKNRIFGLVGEHPAIEKILNEKKIEYKKYSLNNVVEIWNDLERLDAVFANQTNFYGNSLDLHPIFYEILRKKIPLVSRWYWPNNEKTKIFNNAISFYIDENDARILLDEILRKDDIITNRIYEAKNLVDRYFSKQTNLNRVMSAISKGKEFEPEIVKGSVNIDVVVTVGHIGGGDYWIAQDLLNFFPYGKFKGNSITYLDSIIKYKTDINIVVAGVLPLPNKDYVGEKNILYIAYPSFEDAKGVEHIKELDEYIEEIRDVCNEDKGIDLIITASESFNNELNKRGIKSYYVPQFTNTKRFYKDYNKDLESSVLFVGVNTFYRKAWKYLMEAGIDVTIYGPYYPEGVSKGMYIDNRILRKYYSSAKIVLNDTRDGMKKFGFISNRIFDATSCGALVISDYMKEIEDVYGDSVVMWKTKEELIEKVKYYLDPKNEAERLEKANRAKEITLKNFTAEIVEKKFEEILAEIKEK